MDKPVVSILIPVYNSEKYLPKCLGSVMSQTYSDLQIVLIDDGSKDSSWELCQEFVAKDKRVEAWHQENKGVAETRDNLLKKAKGDYVLFVDSDDWIEADMVEYLVSLATELDAEMVMCDRVINDAKPSDKKPEIKILPQEEAIRDFIHHDYFVGALWNKLFKISVVEGLSFHKDIWYGEDALFTWDVLQRVKNVVASDKQLYHFYMNEESISHQAFGFKKLTGHKTWSILTKEVEEKWPQYTGLVHGVFARSDMHLLQAAAQSNYPKNEHIKELQRNVRKNYKFLKPLLKHDLKKLIYATMIMYWYGFGKIYYALNKLKSSVR